MQCSQCGRDGQFYPNNSTLCKLCINRLRLKRRRRSKSNVEFLEREQAAVLNVVTQLQTDGESYVYLVTSNGKVKIGFSTDVNSRIRCFNTAHARPCKLIAVAPGGRQLEKDLHKQFAAYRLNGEWFSHKEDVLIEFRKLRQALVFLPGDMTQEQTSLHSVKSVPTVTDTQPTA